jgi:hypothetical protein
MMRRLQGSRRDLPADGLLRARNRSGRQGPMHSLTPDLCYQVGACLRRDRAEAESEAKQLVQDSRCDTSIRCVTP